LNTHALKLIEAARYSSKLENDLGDVASREGILSRKATALEFLRAQRDLFSTFASKNPVEPFSGFGVFQEQVFRLCNAWHWMHMECFDEHKKAIAGVRVAATQKSGAQGNKTKSKRQETIIEALILADASSGMTTTT
jgi:hypothetical protein